MWSGFLERHLYDHARLLVTEIIRGCVSRAIDIEDPIALHISVTPGLIRVEVSHRCAAPAPRTTPAAAAADGGLLYLLGELADRWGLRDQDPSSIWFELDRP